MYCDWDICIWPLGAGLALPSPDAFDGDGSEEMREGGTSGGGEVPPIPILSSLRGTYEKLHEKFCKLPLKEELHLAATETKSMTLYNLPSVVGRRPPNETNHRDDGEVHKLPVSSEEPPETPPRVLETGRIHNTKAQTNVSNRHANNNNNREEKRNGVQFEDVDDGEGNRTTDECHFEVSIHSIFRCFVR
jgi:hypothetical protein